MARAALLACLLGLALLAPRCGADDGGATDAREDATADAAPDAPDAGADLPDGGPSETDALETIADADALDVPPADGVPDGSADADATPGPIQLTLDPATLQFFSLPIGSYRPAISGLDPLARTCVTLVWMLDDPTAGGFCGTPAASLAYAVLTPDTDGPCGQWEYGGGLGIQEVAGCADWREFGPGHVDLADLTAHLALAPGEPPVYLVGVDNRASTTPPPVTLGLRYGTDVPEDVWVQSVDAYGLPGWATVRRDGQPLVLFDRCDLPVCGEETGVCGQAYTQVHSVTHSSTSGEVTLTWDGRVRVEDPDLHCWKREVAPAGAYELEACFSWQVEDTGSGKVVTNPFCVTAPFSLPTDEAWVSAEMGG